MDVIIVVTQTSNQEKVWQNRLKKNRGILYKREAHLIVIHDAATFTAEGFDFLALYTRAQEKARYMYRLDLFALQKSGASIAIYYDHGAAKKLFPVSASEGGDPFLVKLPGYLENESLCLLEAVIIHTQRMSFSSRGRLFLFRTDLLVFPFRDEGSAEAHIEVHIGLPVPTGPVYFVSLSAQMTFALMRTPLFCNPDRFWIPFLKEPLAAVPSKHCEQMLQFKSKFTALHSEKRFFSLKTREQSSYCWDYGSARSYHQTMLKLVSPDEEGCAMRLFYNLRPDQDSNAGSRVIVDGRSSLFHCNIGSGTIRNSVLIDVQADFLEADHCVIVGSRFRMMQAQFALLYRVHETRARKFSSGTIRADVKKMALYSDHGIDPKAHWGHRLPQNQVSFEQVWKELGKGR